jgi:hypothetical protein
MTVERQCCCCCSLQKQLVHVFFFLVVYLMSLIRLNEVPVCNTLRLAVRPMSLLWVSDYE